MYKDPTKTGGQSLGFRVPVIMDLKGFYTALGFLGGFENKAWDLGQMLFEAVATFKVRCRSVSSSPSPSSSELAFCRRCLRLPDHVQHHQQHVSIVINTRIVAIVIMS